MISYGHKISIVVFIKQIDVLSFKIQPLSKIAYSSGHSLIDKYKNTQGFSKPCVHLLLLL